MPGKRRPSRQALGIAEELKKSGFADQGLNGRVAWLTGYAWHSVNILYINGYSHLYHRLWDVRQTPGPELIETGWWTDLWR